MKGKGQKRVFQINEKEKWAGIAILILVNTDFNLKTIKSDEEGYYIMIKEFIQQKEIMITKIYTHQIPGYLAT